ncbi:DUF167 domain-containing protein [Reyranella sp.]|uniref:DUF167 domain-containing protein n=1 Tax=Reyranella sp. TaxID=1929291 RepID=UPI003BAC4F45
MTVVLRVQPRARRAGLAGTAEGLKAAVTEAPEDGKANQAVLALLAGAWRIPKSAMEVVRGATGREKVVGIAGDPAALAERIGKWTRDQGSG